MCYLWSISKLLGQIDDESIYSGKLLENKFIFIISHFSDEPIRE